MAEVTMPSVEEIILIVCDLSLSDTRRSLHIVLLHSLWWQKYVIIWFSSMAIF